MTHAWKNFGCCPGFRFRVTSNLLNVPKSSLNTLAYFSTESPESFQSVADFTFTLMMPSGRIASSAYVLKTMLICCNEIWFNLAFYSSFEIIETAAPVSYSIESPSIRGFTFITGDVEYIELCITLLWYKIIAMCYHHLPPLQYQYMKSTLMSTL